MVTVLLRSQFVMHRIDSRAFCFHCFPTSSPAQKCAVLVFLQELELAYVMIPDFLHFSSQITLLTSLTSFMFKYVCITDADAAIFAAALSSCTTLAHLSIVLENPSHKGRVGANPIVGSSFCPRGGIHPTCNRRSFSWEAKNSSEGTADTVLNALPALGCLTSLSLSRGASRCSLGRVWPQMPQLINLELVLSYKARSWGHLLGVQHLTNLKEFRLVDRGAVLQRQGLRVLLSSLPSTVTSLCLESGNELLNEGKALFFGAGDHERLLASLTSLKHLQLSVKGMAVTDVQQLSALVNLQELIIERCNLSTEMLLHLLRAIPPGITKMDLAGQDELTDAAAVLCLAQLKSLREMSIRYHEVAPCVAVMFGIKVTALLHLSSLHIRWWGMPVAAGGDIVTAVRSGLHAVPGLEKTFLNPLESYMRREVAVGICQE
jgi:hypothetical protein